MGAAAGQVDFASDGLPHIAAVDGEDAVRKFRKHCDRIKLLLFDVIMPNKNGIAAYDAAVKSLVFGADSDVVKSGRVATVQGIGGTGGLKIGADALGAKHESTRCVDRSARDLVARRFLNGNRFTRQQDRAIRRDGG